MIGQYYSLIHSMGSGAAAIDSDAQAFITAAAITDSTQQSAINTLVTDLKGYGIWTKMKALYPFVGGTASSHKFNLKDPRDLDAAYRLVFAGGWSHSSNGALPNGTNAYADTKLHALNVLTNNNYSLSHYSRTQSTSRQESDLVSIANTGSQVIALSQYYSGYGKFFLAGDNVNNFVISNETNTKGLLIGSRTSNVSAKLYFNGALKTNLTITNTNTLPNANFRLSANPNNVEYSVRESAFASIGDGLTDTEAANFYTAVQAYQTTLNRQV